MQIPEQKRFFRIGEVSRMIGVEPYVLRYWESEFPQIRPSRADSNQRTYQKKDVEIILEVKKLLYEEKLTIEGARQRLRQKVTLAPHGEDAVMDTVRKGLREVLDVLAE